MALGSRRGSIYYYWTSSRYLCFNLYRYFLFSLNTESPPSLSGSNVWRLFSGSRQENCDYGDSSAHPRSPNGFCSSLQTRRSDEKNHSNCYRWWRWTWSPHVPHHLSQVCSSSHSNHRIRLHPKLYHVSVNTEICYNEIRELRKNSLFLNKKPNFQNIFSVTPFFKFTNTP